MIRLGITMGDPKGVGPEIVAKAWNALPTEMRARIRIYGDRTVLEAAANMVGTSIDPKHLSITSSTTPPAGNISDPDASRFALQALDAAIADAKNRLIHAIITAPVNKLRMQLTDPSFEGHTERLAKTSNAKDFVMMFACPSKPGYPQLRVSLVTSHMPLKEVPSRITKQRIVTTINMTAHALKHYFGCSEPRIAVLALNPHTGENGALGTEEQEIIKPAIDKARKDGIICIGPILFETVLRNLNNLDFDAVVAMYHDQGLTPIKLICPQKAVNITLGLPYVRTSPAHGTAEDISWHNQADEQGMLSAIDMALHLLKSDYQ